MFIPLLEERFEEIKEQKFISNRNPTKIYWRSLYYGGKYSE
jgi:hypothetical protein